MLSEVPGRDDLFLLYSVLALASVYLTEEEARADRKFTSSRDLLRFYATQAAEASRQCSDQPSVAAIQGNLVLGLSELITMATASAWMHVGLAIRMAQALRMRNEYNQRRTPRQREIRRRTFWACALLDRLVAYCTFRTQTIDLALVGLDLPCDEVAFAFGLDDPGPRFNELGETDAGNIPLAYFIKSFMLWARVARVYVDGGRRRLGAAPWDPATKCWRNVFDTRAWLDVLPKNMKWSEENLRAHQALGQAAPYISVHFLAQHALFLVHQEHLPQVDAFRGPQRQETPALPSSMAMPLTDVDRAIIGACIDGANNIVQMCRLLDVTMPDPGQQSPVFYIGIPLVTASSVLLWIHHCSQQAAPDLRLTDIQVNQAKADVGYLLSKLSKVPTQIPAITTKMPISNVNGESNCEHQAAPAKTVHCSGTPYEIGLTHGHQAAPEIHRNVELYTAYFRTRAGVSWEDARKTVAKDYLPNLEETYPEIIEEMKGIADGAKLTLEDILALNLRSEILLTAYADGCTSLSQRTNSGTMILSQNWDWIYEVTETVVFLRITAADPDTMTLHMLTEAGIVGKIGMNSAGVGICMNAILCTLKDPARLPVHIMMRRILQYAHSFDEAKSILDKYGLASSVNFMIADRYGHFGDFECTPIEISLIQPLPSPEGPFVAHTNHLYSDVRNRVKDTPAKHSFTRQSRIVEITREDGEKGVKASFESIRARLSDEQGYPFSICRGRPDETMKSHPTVACCMMDLKLGKARFLLGRPCDDVAIVEFEL
ncbi:hypothetical protein ACJ41O_006511 [Fusarium nematophilum]